MGYGKYVIFSAVSTYQSRLMMHLSQDQRMEGHTVDFETTSLSGGLLGPASA